jgi:putative ABC transport system ATP-binding protein
MGSSFRVHGIIILRVHDLHLGLGTRMLSSTEQGKETAMQEGSQFCHERGIAFLEAHALGKTYQVGRSTVYALRDVNFTAAQGDFIVINGPSGSGKTTFLNLISAIDRPSHGEIVIQGVSTNSLSERQLAQLRKEKIGLIFQTFNLIPVLTAAENVEYPLLLQRVPKADRAKRVEAILAEVGLEDLGRRRPNELSGGQRQRIAIARALITRPKLVLADEPTANLDSTTGAQVMELMRRLNEEHCVVFIVVTHDPAVTPYAQRQIRIHDGQLIEGDEQ